MSHSLSVLQKATKADVHSDPFPYILIMEALPADLCNQLIESYPSLDTMKVDASENNHRWSYPRHKVVNNDGISRLWKDFIDYHASEAFFHEIVDLFHEQIHALYPERFPSRDYLNRMRVGTRKLDTFGSKDILMDAQIAGNTPVQASTSVRTTHIDAGDKLFSGLFYLRKDDDSTPGGDLTISRFKPRYASLSDRLSCFRGVYVDDKYLDVVETVKYAKNTAIIFINSIDSLHGVTPRMPTKHNRIFLNLIGEVDPELYRIPERWQMLPQIMKRKFSEFLDKRAA